MQLVLYVVLAPLLVAGATLTARRCGARMGGVISAFPAVVGPLLLLVAHEYGAAATARAANATLFGLVGLGVFAYAYAQLATRRGWGASLAISWICAVALAALVGRLGRGVAFPGGLLVAAAALAGVYRLLPRPDPQPYPGSAGSSSDLPLRMGTTAALILALAAAAAAFGPEVGGLLAGLPILASVLAVFTHREQGAQAAIVLLRGMLSGMAGFVGFCALVALLVVPAGIAVSIACATILALLVQAALCDPAGSGGPKEQAAVRSLSAVVLLQFAGRGRLQAVIRDRLAGWGPAKAHRRGGRAGMGPGAQAGETGRCRRGGAGLKRQNRDRCSHSRDRAPRTPPNNTIRESLPLK
jgi:hypothetical protein